MSPATCLDCKVLAPFSLVLCPLHALADDLAAYVRRAAKAYCDLCAESSPIRQTYMGDMACDHTRARALVLKLEGRE